MRGAVSDIILSPAIETAVHGLPGTIGLRQIAPGNTGPQDSQEAIADLAMIVRRTPCLLWGCQMWLKLLPLLIGQSFSVHSRQGYCLLPILQTRPRRRQGPAGRSSPLFFPIHIDSAPNNATAIRDTLCQWQPWPTWQARASYDRLSRWYDALAGWSERDARGIGLRKLVPQEGETVLEIGFGTGHGLQALAQAVGASGRVHGLDLSKGMIEVTRRRLAGTALAERVDLTCGDATALPYASASLDAVFMSFTLELFDTPEIPTVLQECRRVLRSGGRLGVVSLSKERENPLTRAYEWLHEKLPNWVDCRPIFARRAVEEAGFHIVDVTHTAWWGLWTEIVLAKKPQAAQCEPPRHS